MHFSNYLKTGFVNFLIGKIMELSNSLKKKFENCPKTFPIISVFRPKARIQGFYSFV